MDREKLLKSITELLEPIDALVPKTENGLVKQLKTFHAQLTEDTFNPDDEELLIAHLSAGQKLLNNLLLAQDAVRYTISRMEPTNRPINLKTNALLELERKRINNTELKEAFGFFKQTRDQLSEFTQRNFEFEQTAYRKGTGFNMGMWYRHAHTLTGKKKWGNCSEQSNTAFVYLYTRVREALSAGQIAPMSSLERIDVDNDIGGHSYLIMRGVDKPLSALTSGLNNTSVVVDPWNSDHPFYPICDIPQLMPACGSIGTMNVEFKLGFVAPEEPEVKASPRV